MFRTAGLGEVESVSLMGVKWDRCMLITKFSYRDLSAVTAKKMTTANVNAAPEMALAA